MENSDKNSNIDPNNLDIVQDIETMHGALHDEISLLKSDLEQKTKELKECQQKSQEATSQLLKAQKISDTSEQNMACFEEAKNAAESKLRLVEMEKEVYADRLKEWEHKASKIEKARKELLSIISQIPGGVDAKEMLLRLQEEKNAAENKLRLVEMEKQACEVRLKDWERKASELENFKKDLETRENQCRVSEKSLIKKEKDFEQRYMDMQKEFDEFKLHENAFKLIESEFEKRYTELLHEIKRSIEQANNLYIQKEKNLMEMQNRIQDEFLKQETSLRKREQEYERKSGELEKLKQELKREIAEFLRQHLSNQENK